MVSYATNELIPSSDFAKKFGSYLGQIREHTVEKLAILKNNKVEAVLISKDEYEKMAEALKLVEANEMIKSIQAGLEDVKSGRVQPIEKLWSELDN
ncbi:MAG: type II toxin-antitoxin system Phd/YefM family antitoxin [Sulfurimonas sp.]|uniref:type II toxin-antitoxin system Phd/YefM family antitoxin n=1 Tax=Sulfurimonas sp. TaxID=2022749 RepID=UPI0026139DEC|nr:type II toxin-antitoxin system Phd/YefM family antitoxin [Sulfurimonas sp.]MDD3855411.1 type II toxin-antitoxin system Phd/YefM family antitoxin [Sulfurimonas sp.]